MAEVKVYTSLQGIGIPIGMVVGEAIHIAQDSYTRQYHKVDPKRFIELASGAWKKDAVLSMSYTGAVALIDPPTQTITHIYDSDFTTPDEVATLDKLATEEIMRLIDASENSGNSGGTKPMF